jgi:hypothetical protein
MIKLNNWRGLEATLTLSFHRRYIGRPFTSTMERQTQDLDMDEKASLDWGMAEMPPFEGAPFELVRSSCRHAAHVAQDVAIDQAALHRFATQIDTGLVKGILHSSLGENLDTVPSDFRQRQEAVNFALLFCLLQFGHGFRFALHQYCQRGASQTITLGVRALHRTGNLSAVRLRSLATRDIEQAFALPQEQALTMFVQQLQTVLHQAGTILERLGLEDFAGFVDQHALGASAAGTIPAATLVQQLAHHFPAFNDQGVLRDGSRVVLLKKATLAIGELRRLAAPHDERYSFSPDFHQAVAPVDNVIPAMLVYRGILRLSFPLHQRIHQQRSLLARGPHEAELRSVALDACEQIVSATGNAVSALDLGYYLWRSGKEAGARQFARHHTQDTVFY